MKKLLITPILALSLTGCFYQSVSMSDMQSAMVICASKGAQVDSISSHAIGHEMVTCTDRSRSFINKENLSTAIETMSKQ
jgi:hypothetical protein